MTQRIQKLLATAGLGSRRSIEDWLRDGRITVNGVLAKLGDRAAIGDKIELDGKIVALSAPIATDSGTGQGEVLLYNKPVGEVTTRHDPQGRPTVFDHLPAPVEGRWVVVGRLDVNTAGLLLFTTNGELAHRLMHPSYELPRDYLVRVRGTPPQAALDAMLRGIELDDGPARFDRIEARGRSEGHSWYRVGLHEGRNREVRRLWEAAGYEVSRLTRVAYGTCELPRDLPAGQCRSLSAAEAAGLRAAVRLA
jgi:23S rRNA pseudouridine2605 synthase